MYATEYYYRVTIIFVDVLLLIIRIGSFCLVTSSKCQQFNSDQTLFTPKSNWLRFIGGYCNSTYKSKQTKMQTIIYVVQWKRSDA